MKRCTVCKQLKSKTSFSFRYARCKECQTKKNIEYYEKKLKPKIKQKLVIKTVEIIKLENLFILFERLIYGISQKHKRIQ